MSSLFFPFAPQAAVPQRQPQFYSGNPFGLGLGLGFDNRPAESRHQHRYRRRHRPRYDDLYHRRQEQLRQVQLLREQEERQHLIQSQKRRARSLVAERARLRLYVCSATKIQRAFRKFRDRKINAAAQVVTRFIRNIPAFQRARFIYTQLEEIKALQSSVNQSVCEFGEKTRLFQSDKEKSRARLKYEDALVKLTLTADAIQTRGEDIIRSHRKAFVKKAQSLLAKLDEMSESDEDTQQVDMMGSEPSFSSAEENASSSDGQDMELDG